MCANREHMIELAGKLKDGTGDDYVVYQYDQEYRIMLKWEADFMGQRYIYDTSI